MTLKKIPSDCIPYIDYLRKTKKEIGFKEKVEEIYNRFAQEADDYIKEQAYSEKSDSVFQELLQLID